MAHNLSKAEYSTFLRLIDKDMIRELIARYARALDRLDGDALRDCYWPDGHDSSPSFDGPACAFVNWVMGYLGERRIATHHAVCNTAYDFKGDHAYTETYFIAHSYGSSAEGDLSGTVLCGRYLDHFEKRHSEWRLKHRSRTYEWHREAAYTSASPSMPKPEEGSRSKDDPVYHPERFLR